MAMVILAVYSGSFSETPSSSLSVVLTQLAVAPLPSAGYLSNFVSFDIAVFTPNSGSAPSVGNRALIISSRSSAAQSFLFDFSNLAAVKKLAIMQDMSTLAETTDWSLVSVTGVVIETFLPNNAENL